VSRAYSANASWSIRKQAKLRYRVRARLCPEDIRTSGRSVQALHPTSLSVARRLGSNKGFPSTNTLMARFLRCSIVPLRRCDSSRRAGSRSPSSVAANALAQSSLIRSSILR
jgi:hypothetical protein